MFEIQILIPRYDNHGNGFAAGTYKVWEAELVNRIGGFSKLAGTVAGGWAHQGKHYTDESFVYVVAVASIGDGAKVVQLAHYAKMLFQQGAIFLRYLGVAEVVS